MPTRILVVDDDDCVRFVIRRALENLGAEFDVSAACGGREALALLGDIGFDLIVTDLRMPGIDGVQLTEAVRGLDSRAIVIWMTAYDCSDTEPEAIRLGVFTCLQKPVEVSQIRASVLAALDRFNVAASARHWGGDGVDDSVTQSGGRSVG